MDKRVSRAQLSSGRQALEGVDLAPGTTATLNALRDPQKCTPRPREAIPEIPPHRPLELDEVSFCRKGAASGPSGMTWEHLRPLLDCPRDTNLLHRVASFLARGDVPPLIIDVIRAGRLTALRKSNGGVRGIVAGEAHAVGFVDCTRSRASRCPLTLGDPSHSRR